MTETHLRWCVGKMTYAKGSDHLLHFMPLKDFLIDDSLAIAHLLAIRARRQPKSNETAYFAADDDLQTWMESHHARMVASAAASALEACAESGLRQVTECYAGVGLVFEYLKLQEESKGRFTANLAFQAIGPAAGRVKFERLHAEGPYEASYASDPAPSELRRLLAGSALVIYNHEHAIRQNAALTIPLDEVIEATPAALLVVARVARRAGAARSTIKGRRVELPDLDGLVSTCLRRHPHVQYLFVPNYDERFFLPDSSSDTGLLIACSADRRFGLPGFKSVR